MKRKISLLLFITACLAALLIGCATEDECAAYIYKLHGDERAELVTTLTWDNLNELAILTALGNEAVSSDATSMDTEMIYRIELVNGDGNNDIFEIGFVDEMVCCTGQIQGAAFNHVVSSSVTEHDLKSILGS